MTSPLTNNDQCRCFRLVQRRFVTASLALLTLILSSRLINAGSATWNLNPTSNGWNTAANWTPNTIPNGPSDTATFDSSTQTSLVFTAVTEVNSLVFNPGASRFTFTLTPNLTGITFTISGAGIMNDSGLVQNFVVSAGNPSHLAFTNNAVAGSLTVITNKAGTSDFSFECQTFFYGSSSADHSTIINEASDSSDIVAGSAVFFDTSTAGYAIIVNKPGTGNFPGEGAATYFVDNSSAGSATVRNLGGGAFYAGTTTQFSETSTAGSATIICNGATEPSSGSGNVLMFNDSTAGTANFTANGGETTGAKGAFIRLFDEAGAADATFRINGGVVAGAGGALLQFEERTTGGNATLIAYGGLAGAAGGSIHLLANSTAENARVELFDNGNLDISVHNSLQTAIGSLAGNGLVLLGEHSLSIGNNDISTTFSGVIQDTGSVFKVGTGTLTLGGSSTYTGGTTVTAGTLRVTNESGSATGTGPVRVNTGTLGGKGIIAGLVMIGTGSGAGAVLAPSIGANQLGTLTLQSTLTFKADSTYSYKLNTNTARADRVIVRRVSIESGAQFDFQALGDRRLLSGTSFSVISNAGLTPIEGTFSNLPDNSTFTVRRNSYQVSYEGGDGNDLTLTVVP